MTTHPTATPEPFFGIRQLVTIRPEYRDKLLGDGIYRVLDIPGGRRKTYKIEHVDSGDQVLVRSGRPFEAYDGPAPEVAPPLPKLVVGAVVTCEAGHRIPSDRRLSVLGRGADGAVKVALLGGDDDRYWSSVPRRWLTEVSFGEYADLIAT